MKVSGKRSKSGKGSYGKWQKMVIVEGGKRGSVDEDIKAKVRWK